jgi:hypothetical protein
MIVWFAGCVSSSDVIVYECLEVDRIIDGETQFPRDCSTASVPPRTDEAIGIPTEPVMLTARWADDPDPHSATLAVTNVRTTIRYRSACGIGEPAHDETDPMHRDTCSIEYQLHIDISTDDGRLRVSRDPWSGVLVEPLSFPVRRSDFSDVSDPLTEDAVATRIYYAFEAANPTLCIPGVLRLSRDAGAPLGNRDAVPADGAGLYNSRLDDEDCLFP